MLLRSLTLAALATLTFGANSARADFIIDFNGAAGAGAVTRGGVTSFDYLPGNLLSVPTPVAPGTNFNAYFQAVAGFLGAANPNIPAGFEITIVGTASETAGPVSSGAGFVSQTFAVNGGSFSIYLDSTPDANPGAGTGFTDGTLILQGTISGAINNFTALRDANGNPVLAAFNQTGNPGNNSGTGHAVVGAGAFTTLSSLVTFFDPNFIVLPAGASFTGTTFQGTTEGFFDFSRNAPSTSFAEAGFGGTPNIGTINGVSGPNGLFEIDANQGFQTSTGGVPVVGLITPEPASIAAFALMLGAGAVGVCRRRGA